MPEPIVVVLLPLTPLWTGDAGQRGSRIRETGLLGSLRWWYEAIVRGLGRYACDPSDPSSGPCVYDENKSLASICLACQLFGCTGYGRRFRLVVESNGDAGNPVTVKSKQSQTYFESLNDRTKHRGWRIPPNVAGPFTLFVHPMRPGALDDFASAAIYHTLRFIERYGALGAKTSHGQGVMKITDWSTLAALMETDAWIGAVGVRPAKAGSNPQPAPNLSDFIGATVTLDAAATSKDNWWQAIPLTGLERFSFGTDPSWIASAPALRAQLRGWLRNNANFPGFNGDLRTERHSRMGTIQAPVGPKSSDIFVTHLYKAGDQWCMRIFAFVAKNGSAVALAVRAFLADPAALKPEIRAGLGAIPVEVATFPTDVRGLLTGEGEKEV
ncbi:MAG: type III-B CRISPR module RAMP protein Cmr1 [Armatimonadetes bacterium]|nr:type III-B CRISPR module RAMP protein Cmr1 [Armatimonadota bacterium]